MDLNKPVKFLNYGRGRHEHIRRGFNTKGKPKQIQSYNLLNYLKHISTRFPWFNKEREQGEV